MFNSYRCSNANYYPLTSPIVIQRIDRKQTEFNILSFAINKDDKKIYSYNVLYAIENNTCTVKNSGRVSLSNISNKGLNVYLEQNNK